MKKTVGKNLMAATWTKAAQVRRAFKAGRQRQTDLILGAERAVIQCRILSLDLRAAMLQAGIERQDGDLIVGLVTVSPERVANVLNVEPLPEGRAELLGMTEQAILAEESEGWSALGSAVRLVDREAPGEPVSTWVNQWLVGPRADRAAKEAQRVFALVTGEKGVGSTF